MDKVNIALDFARSLVERFPLSTVAGAFVLGFLLG